MFSYFRFFSTVHRSGRAAVGVLCLMLLGALFWPQAETVAEEPRPREVPEYLGRVNDYASRLSHDSEMILEHISFKHEKLYGDRIILLTIDSLKGNDAEEFARRTLKVWELAGTDEQPTRVVLILLAVQEKRVRIQTSAGMEKELSAEKRAEILGQAILPELKKRHYSIGLYRGFAEITSYLGQKYERRKAMEKDEKAAKQEQDPKQEQKKENKSEDKK